jgi:limonene-1,2-epoxide hydrolase
MVAENPIDIVLRFMDKINEHDVPAIVSSLSDDHVLVDSLGNELTGRDKLRSGWKGYFKMCPDYRVSHESISTCGFRSSAELVSVFGTAGGTIAKNGTLPAENKWQVPAAWQAAVREGKIVRWQVYADNKPVYEILGRR